MKVRGLALATLSVLLGAGGAAGQQRPVPDKLRIIFSAIGTSQSPLWIAKEANLFQKHGLDAELLYVAGGSRAAQVVLSGEAPVAMFNGAAVIAANLAGAELVNVASGMNVLPFFLVAGPSIKQIEDLRGKRVAITRFASATDYALRFAAEKWPVKPDRDFTVVQLGGQPEMMAALQSGAVEAAMLNAEFTILARRQGHRDLADVASMGLAFPGSGLNTSRSFIRNRRETMLRVLRAYTEAVHYGRTRKKATVAVLGRYLKNQDVAFLEAVRALYLERYIPRVPYPSPVAMRRALEDVAEKDPRARSMSAEQFIDGTLMQELDKQGFINQLWR